LYLENTFGIKIKNSEINEENFRTVSAIANVVRRAGGE
jgi:acyl carrier protein